MADHFTETTHSSFGQNIIRSLLGIPVGILLFIASFAVLWLTEGRTDWAKIAADTQVATPDRAAGFEGRAVSVTGVITSTELLGDPEFVAPGPFIALRRDVEQFAWVESQSGRTTSQTGGSSNTQTTYTYRTDWTANPRPASEFRVPANHDNVPLAVPSTRFVAPCAAVASWSLDIANVQLEPDTVLPPTAILRTGRALEAVPTGNHLFLGTGTPDAPHLGDVRVRFTALRNGTVVTTFGQARAGSIKPLNIDGTSWLRVLSGERPQAIQALAAENTAVGWIGRIVGFLMMWIGMLLFLGPVSTFLNVLPFLGSASRFVTMLVTFPLALLLTGVTVVVAMVAHSLVALVASVLVLIVGLLVLGRGRKPATA